MSVTPRNVLKVAALASSVAVLFTILILTMKGCGPDCELGSHEALWSPWTRPLDGATRCVASTEPAGCGVSDAGCTAVLTAAFDADVPPEAVRTKLEVYLKGHGYALDAARSTTGADGQTETRWVEPTSANAFVVRVTPKGDGFGSVEAQLRHKISAGATQ